MNAYKALAVSYDRLTNDVDYEATVACYRQILAAEGLHPRTAVDLACGTGSVTAILAPWAFPPPGVDMSEMLTCGTAEDHGLDTPALLFLPAPGAAGPAPGWQIWLCAPWTAWTISPSPKAAGKPFGGYIGHFPAGSLFSM